jgi:hypothetical protein
MDVGGLGILAASNRARGKQNQLKADNPIQMSPITGSILMNQKKFQRFIPRSACQPMAIRPDQFEDLHGPLPN